MPWYKFIIFDGSHNLAGAEKLNKYLIENNIKPNVIFGMLDNKNAFEFLAILKKNIDTLYPITIPGEPNAFSKNEIYNISSQLNINCIVRNNFRSINQSIMKQSNK